MSEQYVYQHGTLGGLMESLMAERQKLVRYSRKVILELGH